MKRPHHLLRFWISSDRLFFIFLVISSGPVSGVLSSRVVTLGSIQIFNTHGWFGSKPTVYFCCKGENKTTLPDVKKTLVLYSFKGEESWQPLTEFPDKKCKRCGVYEKDTINPDDIFDEWELCPDDFVEGKYTRFKDKEFNATFICPECNDSIGSSQNSSRRPDYTHKNVNVALVVIISVMASIVAVIGSVATYKYWQKRKREQDQVRFLKLFEEGDDIEDELGLGHL